MKSSNIGGQAVMEGVMMRSGDQYAVAVRKPDQTIAIKTEPYKSVIKNKKLTTIPLIRGVFNFIDSMVVGMKTLTYSASFFEEEEPEAQKVQKVLTESQKEKKDSLAMGLTVAFSLIMAVSIFMLLPYFLASIIRLFTSSNIVIAIAEALIRIVIFMTYILLISRMKEIRRVFMYHGAEHKCINCIEHGLELNVDNVMKSSRLHKRCGTSFLLIVMVISVIFFMFIRVESPFLRVGVRILLVPVIAGISYEIIRLAGRSESPLVNLISKPGMMLQKLTTIEPEPEMVEVAIASVEAVFDWHSYLVENFEAAAGGAKSSTDRKNTDNNVHQRAKEDLQTVGKISL